MTKRDRGEGGKFLPGHGVKSPGRPPGKNRAQIEEWREMVARRMPELLEKSVEMALDGDTQALRLLLARLWPEQQQAVAELQEQLDELKDKLEVVIQRRAA